MNNLSIPEANFSLICGIVFAIVAIAADARYRAGLLTKSILAVAAVNFVVGASIYANSIQEANIAAANSASLKDTNKLLTTKVGAVLNGKHSESGNTLFSRPFTSIETDKGVYKVSGTQIVTKGDELEIQLRASGIEYLCISGLDGRCMQLIN